MLTQCSEDAEPGEVTGPRWCSVAGEGDLPSNSELICTAGADADQEVRRPSTATYGIRPCRQHTPLLPSPASLVHLPARMAGLGSRLGGGVPMLAPGHARRQLVRNPLSPSLPCMLLTHLAARGGGPWTPKANLCCRRTALGAVKERLPPDVGNPGQLQPGGSDMVPQRSNQALVVGLVFALCFGATAWAQTLQ